MSKLNYYYTKIRKEDLNYPVFTQPSMAFTPRQIIEQFASGEIIAEENEPSDEFYDDKYSEEQLLGLTAIDDDFILRQKLLDYQESQENEQKEINSGNNVPPGSSETSASDVRAGESAEHGEQTQA